MYSLRYASSFLNVPKKVSATAFSPAGRFLLEYDSFWPYVKPPMWCFYSTPHRRFTQNLGWSLEFNVSFEEFQALYLEGEPEESKGPGGATLLAIETKARQAV